MFGLRLFPDQASTTAGQVDAVFFFILALSILVVLLIGGTILYFVIRYRRRSEDEIPPQIKGSNRLELAWTIIPFGVFMIFFFLGANVYLSNAQPPPNSMEIYVVARQWMWKFEHVEGQQEINELHVPIGKKIKLVMATEDVIHSFYVPAFRFKVDAVPGRYTYAWFEATKPGRYHLFCAEYCGTSHSKMGGWVVVMEQEDYQAWLSGGTVGESLSSLGQKLFQNLACVTCHHSDGQGRGPALEGLFGKTVELEGGQTVNVDEGYLRESILNPQAKIVLGYQPIMPTFQGLVSEEQLLQLVEYIKSIGPKPAAGKIAGQAALPAAKPGGKK